RCRREILWCNVTFRVGCPGALADHCPSRNRCTLGGVTVGANAIFTVTLRVHHRLLLPQRRPAARSPVSAEHRASVGDHSIHSTGVQSLRRRSLRVRSGLADRPFTVSFVPVNPINQTFALLSRRRDKVDWRSTASLARCLPRRVTSAPENISAVASRRARGG